MKYYGCNFMRTYFKSKRVAIVAPRDTFLNTWYNQNSDGSIEMVSFTVDDEILSEEKNLKFFIKAAGFIITPIPGDPQKCKMTYYLETTLRGSIPQFVMKLSTERQAYTLDNFAKLLPKFVKENKDLLDKYEVVK